MLFSDGVETLKDIVDASFMAYAASPDYTRGDTGLVIGVDGVEGEPQRMNRQIKQIDSIVQIRSSLYKERSHFFATAALHELFLK